MSSFKGWPAFKGSTILLDLIDDPTSRYMRMVFISCFAEHAAFKLDRLNPAICPERHIRNVRLEWWL